MSSPGCPPQLHLSLANTTSFKRSFEQFGVDLESPIGNTPGSSVSASESRPGTGSGASDGNDRKRAKSEGSSSSSGTDISISTSEVSSSNDEASGSNSDAGSPPSPSTAASPVHSPLSAVLAQGEVESHTPDVEMVDSVMTRSVEDLASWSSAEDSEAPSGPTTSQQYGEVLERFHAFDSEISALRRSPSTSPPPELPPIRPDSPPVLPPIVVTEEYPEGPLSEIVESASLSRSPQELFDSRHGTFSPWHTDSPADWPRMGPRSQFISDRFAQARRTLATPRLQDEDYFSDMARIDPALRNYSSDRRHSSPATAPRLATTLSDMGPSLTDNLGSLREHLLSTDLLSSSEARRENTTSTSNATPQLPILPRFTDMAMRRPDENESMWRGIRRPHASPTEARPSWHESQRQRDPGDAALLSRLDERFTEDLFWYPDEPSPGRPLDVDSDLSSALYREQSLLRRIRDEALTDQDTSAPRERYSPNRRSNPRPTDLRLASQTAARRHISARYDSSTPGLVGHSGQNQTDRNRDTATASHLERPALPRIPSPAFSRFGDWEHLFDEDVPGERPQIGGTRPSRRPSNESNAHSDDASLLDDLRSRGNSRFYRPPPRLPSPSRPSDPLSREISVRRLYATRPGPSNSLMSETASERQRIAARAEFLAATANDRANAARRTGTRPTSLLDRMSSSIGESPLPSRWSQLDNTSRGARVRRPSPPSSHGFTWLDLSTDDESDTSPPPSTSSAEPRGAHVPWLSLHDLYDSRERSSLRNEWSPNDRQSDTSSEENVWGSAMRSTRSENVDTTPPPGSAFPSRRPRLSDSRVPRLPSPSRQPPIILFDSHNGREVPSSSQAAALFATRPTSPSRTREEVPPGAHIDPSLLAPRYERYGPMITDSVAVRSSPNLPEFAVLARARLRAAMESDSDIHPSSPPRTASEENQFLSSSTQPLSRTARAETPSSGYGTSSRNIDIDAYHHGPFRASLARMVERERLRSEMNEMSAAASRRGSVPPSLPPLRFDPDYVDMLNVTDARSPTRSEPPQPSRDNLASPLRFEERVDRVDTAAEFGRRLDHMTATSDQLLLDSRRRARHYMGVAPAAGRPSPSAESSRLLSNAYDAARERRETHDAITRRARMESSRLRPSAPVSRGQLQGFNHALDVLRGDGLSPDRREQLTNQFERETGEARRRPANHWGDIEGEHDGQGFFHSRLGDHLRRRRSASSLFVPSNSSQPSENPHLYRRERATDVLAAAYRRSPSPSGPASPTQVPTPSTSAERAAVRAQRYARLRASRARMHTRNDEMFPDGLARTGFSDFASFMGARRARNFGDYMRDEDFDASYENLLSLATSLGEAKPRATPQHIIASLPTGFYKDWQTPDCDKRCPICLDDYKSLDPVLKVEECSHWFHKECLEQWLRGARSCPVCRKRIRGRHGHSSNDQDPGPSGSGSGNGNGNGNSGGGGGGSESEISNGGNAHGNNDDGNASGDSTPDGSATPTWTSFFPEM